MSISRRDFLRLSALLAAEAALLPAGITRSVLAGSPKNNGQEASVFYNAKVYTSDKNNPSATAFVVKDGQFIYVGDDQGALAYGKGTDLQGKRIIPGIVDAHTHPVFAALLNSYDMIMIDSKANLEEVLAFLKKTANDDEHKDQPFVLGMGIGFKCRPNLAVDLDKAIPDRPAAIFSDDGHAIWLNTKAMEKAGLTKDIPDPVPGASFFVRDDEGNPTGYIVESTAEFYACRKMGIFSKELVLSALPKMLELFSQNGITSICDTGFVVVDEAVALEALRELERDDKLNMRFFTSYIYTGEKFDSPDHMLKTMLKNREKYASDLVEANTLKMFVDGTLEVLSAWMKEDLMPPGKGRGAPLLTFDEMATASKAAAARDFNIHIHAIGDAAITQAMDVYKAVGKSSGTKTICHAQFMPEDGVRRLSEQKDVFIQSTPYWLLEDEWTKKALGEERYWRQPPYASFLANGVLCSFGSDFPVSGGKTSLNPFNNIFVAVNRATDEGIIPPRTEAISVAKCIDAYTINGAIQIAASDRVGSISVGKSADFVVCSDDVLAVEPQKIGDVTVAETYSRGKCVYRK